MTEKRLDFIDLKTQQEKILPALNERIRQVLAHGQYILGPEVNELEARLAAILLVKLESFDQEVAHRQKVAHRYGAGLRNVVEVPYVSPQCTSVWAQYSVLSDHRGELQRKLQEAGIPSAVYYPLPLHRQGAFASLGYKVGDFPVSEHAAGRIFSLPMHPYLTEKDQKRIISVLLS